MANKVLVVDDEVDLVGNLTFFLESEGFQVQSCHSGREVIQKTLSFRPAVIVLDVMMPGVDGFEALRRLKADDEVKDIPVIMLTAMTHKASELTGRGLGAETYLTKPVAYPVLLQEIKRVLPA